MNDGKRLPYFDNLKGILITLVVIGHVIEPMASAANLLTYQVVDFLYLFHMPLFIFVSGLFSKGVYRDGRFRAEVPLFYIAVCVLLYAAMQPMKHALGLYGGFDLLTLSNGSIPWYLMALAAYVIAVPLFSQMLPAVAIVGSVALAVASGFYEAGDVLTVARTCTFLPFFLAGFYMDPRAVERFLMRLRERHLLGLVRIAALLALAAAFALLAALDEEALAFLKRMFTGRNSYEAALASSGVSLAIRDAAAVRLGYYLAVPAVSACLLALVPLRPLGIVTGAGERSLQIYFAHPFLYYPLHHALALDAAVYAAVPEHQAIVALAALGALAAALLALPRWPQRLFGGLKRLVRRIAVRTEG